MSSRSETIFDPAEVAALLEFLEDAPGRISIVEVLGPSVADELKRVIRANGSLPMREVTLASPVDLASRIAQFADEDCAIVIGGLDQDDTFRDDAAAARFWRDMNLQREKLAPGRVRCCLVVNPDQHDRMAAHADDLRSWAREFSFLASLTPIRKNVDSSSTVSLSVGQEAVSTASSLNTLRSQVRRARSAGVAEGILVRDFVVPLFSALVRAQQVHEASELWERDLRDGDALTGLPEGLRIATLLDRTLLARVAGDLPSAHRAALAAREMAEAGLAVEETPERSRDLLACRNALADVLMEQGRIAEAAAELRLGIELVTRLVMRNPEDPRWRRAGAIANNRLGDVLTAEGNSTAALKALRASLDAWRQLREAGDDSASHEELTALVMIGDLLKLQGDLSGALTEYRLATEIAEQAVAQDSRNAVAQRDLAIAYMRVGDALKAHGDGASALSRYSLGLALARKLAASEPENRTVTRDVAVFHNRIGDVLAAQGDLAAAQAEYEAATTTTQRLVELDPSNAEWLRDLAIANVKVGDLHLERGDAAAAELAYRDSLQIRERLASQDPSNARWQRDLSVCRNRVGEALERRGETALALAEYRAALATVTALASRDPWNAELLRDQAVGHSRIGDLLTEQGDPHGALGEYLADLAITEKLARLDPANARWQRDLLISRLSLRDTYRRLGDEENARREQNRMQAILSELKERGVQLPTPVRNAIDPGNENPGDTAH